MMSDVTNPIFLEDAVINAARQYRDWAKRTGDYPHDQEGCEAHSALVAAIELLDLSQGKKTQ